MSASLSRIQGALDAVNDPNADAFTIVKFLKGLAGPTLVRVVSCTNNGGVSAYGFVNVLPLVNQLNGEGQPTPHGVVNNMMYSRLQGGSNAVICDPEPNDVGIAIFCTRDVSAVKAAAAQGGTIAQQSPPSFRWWDWADGVYLGWVLNRLPSQYFQLLQNGAGINVVSPQQITLTAPTVTINASTGVNVNTPTTALSQNLTIGGTTTGQGDGVFAGVSVSTHLQSGVQSGGDDSGPPVPA